MAFRGVGREWEEAEIPAGDGERELPFSTKLFFSSSPSSPSTLARGTKKGPVRGRFALSATAKGKRSRGHGSAPARRAWMTGRSLSRTLSKLRVAPSKLLSTTLLVRSTVRRCAIRPRSRYLARDDEYSIPGASSRSTQAVPACNLLLIGAQWRRSCRPSVSHLFVSSVPGTAARAE